MVGLVILAVNGCRKRNSFSTSLVAAAAAVVGTVDIHDCLYVCICDGGGGVVVVYIHDASLTAGMSVFVMLAATVDTHHGSVETPSTFHVFIFTA